MSDYEIRPDTDGSPDEVIVRNPKNVHFERLSNGEWWCGIDLGMRTLHVDICTSAKCRHKLRFNAEER